MASIFELINNVDDLKKAVVFAAAEEEQPSEDPVEPVESTDPEEPEVDPEPAILEDN